MPESKSSLNWQDIIVRTAIPGVLIAFTGFVSEWAITNISSEAENARLVTNLQIQREQAESDLRKDIFDQAVAALIGERARDGEIEDYSKRLLKLELLALNFGDSISLSPLFAEFERDLNRLDNAADFVSVNVLRKRLRSLAKRVASAQLSFLGQRGTSIPIRVALTTDGKEFCHGKAEYKWPDDDFLQVQPCTVDPPPESPEAGAEDEAPALPVCPGEDDVVEGDTVLVQSDLYPDALESSLLGTATIALDSPKAEQRYMIVTFSDPNPNQMTVRVSLEVCRFQGEASCDTDDADAVEREFTLDYFNFPTIDNTRLTNNDRFALVLEDFALGDSMREAGCDANASTLNVSVALFPSEYASLRDRPTMRESLELLQNAQEHTRDEKELR